MAYRFAGFSLGAQQGVLKTVSPTGFKSGENDSSCFCRCAGVRSPQEGHGLQPVADVTHWILDHVGRLSAPDAANMIMAQLSPGTVCAIQSDLHRLKPVFTVRYVSPAHADLPRTLLFRAGPGIDALPRELMVLCFSYLKDADLVRCSQVSHSLMDAARDPMLWRFRTVQLNPRRVVRNAFHSIGTASRPVVLPAYVTRVTAVGVPVALLTVADQLEHLDISLDRDDVASITALARYPLTSLALRGNRLSLAQEQALVAACPSLRCLSFGPSESPAAAVLGNLTGLTHLDLFAAHTPSDDLGFLSRLTRLTTLRIINPRQADLQAMPSSLTALTAFSFTGGLDAFAAGHTALQSLALHCKTRLSAAHLASLEEHCPLLTSLAVDYRAFNGYTLAGIEAELLAVLPRSLTCLKVGFVTAEALRVVPPRCPRIAVVEASAPPRLVGYHMELSALQELFPSVAWREWNGLGTFDRDGLVGPHPKEIDWDSD